MGGGTVTQPAIRHNLGQKMPAGGDGVGGKKEAVEKMFLLSVIFPPESRTAVVSSSERQRNYPEVLWRLCLTTEVS